MNSYFFVLGIIAIVMTATTIQHYFRLQSKKQDVSSDAEEYEQRIAELEERIRVLERIVTENKYDLKQEIDRL